MRLLKPILIVVVLALVAAGLFAWTLPAEIGYRYAAPRLAPLVLSGLRGTVWNGHADGVGMLGHDFGTLDWTAPKGPLLRGEFVADVRLRGSDGELAGTLTRGRGWLAADHVRFSLPAAALAPALELGAAHPRGTLSGELEHATLAKVALRDARGSVRWSGAGVSGAAEVSLPDVLAEFASQPDGSVAGRVHDDGSGNLAIEGTFTLRIGGADALVHLRARNDDAQVAELLRRVGEPQPDGSSILHIRSRAPRLF
ncbi:MAG: type II secretion system protein N [Rhodanobacteraceae bacterium]|jgi:hypothetical protein|nr:type II secretion system protein N [Rhodanobacteraceae bacterium]